MQQVFTKATSPEEDAIDIQHYIKLIYSNWLKIASFTVLITIIAVLIALQITPKYTATATLLIESKEKQAVTFEDALSLDSNKQEYYNTQYEILRSSTIAEKVIKKLNLDQLKEFNPSLSNEVGFWDKVKESPLFASLLKKEEVNEEDKNESVRQSVINAVKSRLTISPISSTHLVNISFESKDRKLAAKIANEVGYAYIETNLESKLSATQYASSWITGRLSDLRDQLSKSEQALSDFLINEKLIDDSGIQTLASQELANLTKRLADVRDQRIETESAYSALTSGHVTDVGSLSSIPAISQHPQVIAIRQAELAAINQVKELSKRYGPKHDKMIQAQAKLDSVEAQAKDVTEKLIAGIGKELQAQRKQEQLLEKEINDKKSNFQTLTVKRSKYEALQREVETNRELLNTFLTKQKETSATEDYDSAVARFTDMAAVPQYPSKPNKKLIVGFATFVSICFSIFIILVNDLLKNSISTEKGLEDKFGFLPLASVPKIKSKRFAKKPIDSSIFGEDKESIFSESIRSIRTSLMLSNINKSHKTIAITSSLAGEGKTSIAVNMAQSFATIEKTLIIDCDLRKPNLAERFGFKSSQQGLTNHLAMGTAIEDCLYQDSKTGLTILPAGMFSANPQEILSSAKFKLMLDNLADKFDRVILDTPPTIPVSDTLIIGKMADSVLLVIKANETKINTIRKTINKLISHDLVIDGVVLNQVSERSSADKHYGYYGYGTYGKNAE
ncbi:GumC family protein [Vibrio viridaestus]|uniref:non-specific protein-tyrosine kinase n=1 Tax=Vibrio viridaestus TaxID=2487322 RepID=A0A3N9U2W3_9VIBR|nr:polysaccharide biosynthesis tyrosine autokinase [Vibrio viridaestus]RQW63882.1 polysaccharide biosynthesis tyrosine autokinase [Vibrio viridaestus]